MQQIVIDSQCMGFKMRDDDVICYPHFGGPGRMINIPVQSAYQTNMRAINTNFETLFSLNRNCAQDLTSLNASLNSCIATMSQIHAELADTKQQNTTLLAELNRQKTLVEQVAQQMTEIRERILHVFQFLPVFIRHVSANFLKLLVSMKSSIVLDDLPQIQA